MPNARPCRAIVDSLFSICASSFFRSLSAPVLGGGLSNLWERLRRGAVYDYVQFPKLPKIGRYVWNLADLAILIGGLLLALLERKK